MKKILVGFVVTLLITTYCYTAFAKDRDNNGHTKKGIQNANAKLNNQKVVQIRSLRSKMSLNQLAKKFKVSKKLILLVVQKKIWKHVK